MIQHPIKQDGSFDRLYIEEFSVRTGILNEVDDFTQWRPSSEILNLTLNRSRKSSTTDPSKVYRIGVFGVRALPVLRISRVQERWEKVWLETFCLSHDTLFENIIGNII